MMLSMPLSQSQFLLTQMMQALLVPLIICILSGQDAYAMQCNAAAAAALKYVHNEWQISSQW